MENSEVPETPRSEPLSSTSSQGLYGRQSTAVVLNFEALSSGRHKMIQTCWGVLLLMGAAGNGAVIYFKAQSDASKYLINPVIFQINTAVASCCVLSLGAMLLRFSWLLVTTKRDGCTWNRRQRYLVTVPYLQNLFQFINVVFFLVPNAHVLHANCAWFDSTVNACAYIRWFCLFTVFCLQAIHATNMCPALDKDGSPNRSNPRLCQEGEPLKDPMVLDLPFWMPHWWKLAIWLALEASVITVAAIGIESNPDPAKVLHAPPSCPQRTYPSPISGFFVIITIIWGAGIGIYQAIIQIGSNIAIVKLAAQPYNLYNAANLMSLWQKRLTTWIELLGILEISIVVYAQYNENTGYFLVWLGLMPLELLMTASVLANAYYFLPRNPSDEEHLLQVWRQDFAWTEADVAKKLAALHKRSPGLELRLRDEPIFCAATALKLLLWSTLVYEETDPESPLLGARAAADAASSSMDSEEHELLRTEQAANGESESSSGDVGSPDEDATLGLAAEQLNGTGHSPQAEPHQAANHQRAPENGDLGPQLQALQTSPLDGSVHPAQVPMRSGELDCECADAQALPPGPKEPGALVGVQDGGLAEMKLGAAGVLKEEAQHVTVQVDKELSSEEQMRLGMHMYHLTDLKVFHEAVTDTKVVVAWSSSTMVLAFRGTNSMLNVLSDAKGWRAPHPPKRGRFWLWSMPMVHHGFLGAWLKIGLNARVLAHVDTVLQGAKVPPSEFRVYLTGHSLGGALATLAALDIQKAHHLPKLQVCTFGAPRTGNHAWAQEAEQVCPHTWHVILDGDAVPRAFKFLWLYKRAGNRVLLNQLGDVRVRPTVWEVCLHKHGFTISQHLLSAYLTALGSLCIAQLVKFKGLEGGDKGVAALAKSPDICALLATAGVDLPLLVKHPPKDLGPKELAKLAKGSRKWRCIQPNLVAMARSLPFSDRLEANYALLQGERQVRQTPSMCYMQQPSLRRISAARSVAPASLDEADGRARE